MASKRAENLSMDTLSTAHTERVNSSYLVELRKNPRYATRLEALVVSTTGASALATVVDLSAGGLRLQLDQTAFTAILPGESRSSAHNPVELTIYFNLPGDPQQPPSVRLSARTIHRICGEDGLYQLGVSFNSILDGRAELRHYLKYRKAVAR